MSVTVPMTNVDVNIPPSPSYRSEYHDQDHDVPQDSSNATNSNHNASSSNGNLNHSHDDSGITSNDGDKSNGLIVNEAHASSSKDARVTSNDEDDDDSQYSTVHDDDDNDNNDDDGEYEYGSNTNAEEEVIKLFVGQVPKNMEEADLFTIFEQYGPMEDVAIIRDKHTGQHRGCAFVTFLSKESAEQCERELHGTFPFEGGKRPVQVRPAGKREDNKVFVGMLPKNVSEEMVTEVFESFGEISGVFVIKSTDGYRKGCAFVKFVHRDDALNAIEELNNKIVFHGTDRPIIVKIADSKPEKRLRMNQQRTDSNGQVIGLPHPHAHGHNQAGFVRISSAHGSLNGSVYSDTASESPQMNGHPGNLFFMPGHLNMPPSSHPHGHPHAHHIYNSAGNVHGVHHTQGHPPPAMEHVNTSAATEYGQMYHHSPALQGPFMDQIYQQQQHQHPNHQQNNVMRPPRHDHGHPQAQAANARPREGPGGANLFIYHLPHDLTDADLATAFNPFGNVISAKVYVDKYTGESKGFGFVSYDSIISAEQAIELMNGFQIGNKRLKVQHKRVHHGQPQGGAQGFPMPNMQNGFSQPVMGPPRPPPYHYPQDMGQGVPGQMMQGGGHTFEGDGMEFGGSMFEVGNAHPGFHDTPVPSIEIESKGDDNALALRTIVSVDHSEINALAQNFSGLNANERGGNV